MTALATLVLAGAGGATTSATVLSARNGVLGEILVSARGRTLYHDSAQRRGRIDCVRSRAVTWPPLVIVAYIKPLAGRGVSASLLGTVKRPDDRLQVTYRGLPLYLFSGDTKPGQVNGTVSAGPAPGVNPSMWCAANPQSCVNGVPVTHKR
jgi:predicted lipoprotein with Yx(FWY)xxD motif